MKTTPRLLSVGQNAKMQELHYMQTMPGMQKMQNDANIAKNPRNAKNAKMQVAKRTQRR